MSPAQIIAVTANLRRANRWRGKLPIPEHAPDLVKEFFRLMNKERAALTEIAERSGNSRAGMSDWRYRRSPALVNFEAALNALGYELKIVRRREREAA